MGIYTRVPPQGGSEAFERLRLRVYSRGWFKVRVPFEQMKLLAADPAHFDRRPTEQSLFSFAKAYYKGGGWWLVSGYDHRSRDTMAVFTLLANVVNVQWGV